jgi:hypothetical protein
MLKFKNLRVGQAFSFYRTDGDRSIFVRCHGGIRPGCGGQLVKTRNINPLLAVELYQTA